MAKKVAQKDTKPNDGLVKLDLNYSDFQDSLFSLNKQERKAVLDTFNKRRKLTWDQVYRDQGLKWEKLSSIKPPSGIKAIYSLRITRSRRATAYREQDFLRFLTISPDHDSTYGKK